jgi:hypothetical protein
MEKLEWQAPEYIHTEKTGDWYWIVGIISVSIFLISAILGDIIFGLLVLVSTFALSLFASRPPETVTHEIAGSGITKGGLHINYDEIKSFWVETTDRYPRILFKTDRHFSPYFIFLIHPDDADQIRVFLQNHLKEEKMTESIFEKLLIYFGF